MSPLLNEILGQAEQLTPEERLELIQKLVEGLRTSEERAKSQTKWRDLRGMAPYPMMGEDAQEWVSRTRRESDEYRERALRADRAD